MSVTKTPFAIERPPSQSGGALLAAPTWLVFFLGALLLVSPWSTKAAGVPLFLMWAWGAWLAWRHAPCVPADPLVKQWCWIVLGVFGLRAAATLLWDDPWRNRHFEGRLLVCGLALWCLSTRVSFSEGQKRWTTHASALACLAALCLTWMHGRDTPTNAIPWAAGVSFLVCVLLARCLDSRREPYWQPVWLVSALAGMGGVLLSQSRGSYGLVPWVVFILAVVFWRSFSRPRMRGRVTGAFFALVLMVLGALSFQPRFLHEPMARMKAAQTEFSTLASAIRDDKVTPALLDTSVGARLYMYVHGWQAIQQAPLAGHGESRLGSWVRDLGEDNRSEVIRSLSHLHSDLLSIWFGHGVLGLSSYALSVMGLVWLAWLARMRSLGMSLGFAGLAWMHLSSGLTSLNTIHNYYGVMLSLSVLLLFLLDTPDRREKRC